MLDARRIGREGKVVAIRTVTDISHEATIDRRVDTSRARVAYVSRALQVVVTLIGLKLRMEGRG